MEAVPGGAGGVLHVTAGSISGSGWVNRDVEQSGLSVPQGADVGPGKASLTCIFIRLMMGT